jgi:NAD(P)-dependent dehydrogenase (short-subunit alcohol dehydrogenase family)
MGIEITGKVALITGGAQGIGLGIAKEFLNARAKVAISDINEGHLKETTDDLKNRFGGGNVHGIVADIALEEDVKKMVIETVRRFDAIDVLVNNAGIGAMNHFWDMSVEEWDAVFNVNLRGAFLCNKEVVKLMLEKGIKGRIINVSSINDHMPTTGMSAYCVSKAGISMFTRVAALELGPHGINVNAVAPGFTMTPMTEGLLNFPGFKKAALDCTPKGRYGEPEDIARVALFLASEYADWVTGQIINVDGGVSLIGLPKYYEELRKAL